MHDRGPATPPGRTDHRPAAYSGPSRDEVLAMRREYVNPGVFLYYDEPLCIVEGHMQYLWDEKGRQYLDAIAGIVSVSVGHCHPLITERLREQVGRLVHTTTIYLHPYMPQLAREIARRMPAESGLSVTYFANSGGEANELAALMSRLHTGGHEIIALRNSYHGASQGTTAMTGIGTWRFPLPVSQTVRFTAPGYCYRCPFGLSYPSCDVRCARSVEDVIRHETGGGVAAFIAEPIQGVGGVIVPPPEYFGIVYEIVRRHGGLCISDEVQTGWGRTGAHYWGFENWGVTPDVVTTAKGMANGSPLAACTTRREIAEHTRERLHFHTFAGNPVSMLAGLTTLEIIEREQLQRRAAEVGGYLKEKLLGLAERHALIGEVRGMGLMLGIELVRDRDTKEPAGQETRRVMEKARQGGLLVGRGGLDGNVIRIKPPMCITRDDCDFLAATLDGALADVEGK